MNYAGILSHLVNEINLNAHPLQNSADLDPLLERIGDAHYVLLGEASHGTHEYYLWRAMITKRLVEEKGFNFIAVEGDWPDCYEINRYIKSYNGYRDAVDVLNNFERWPNWMWANWEVASLAEWLKKFNQGKDDRQKIGFYGLDVYSLWESLESIDRYVRRNRPQLVDSIKEAVECFEPYNKDIYAYARKASFIPGNCQDEVVELLADLRKNIKEYADHEEDKFNAEQNAQVVVNAETYYRKMIDGGSATWNIRDRHMMDTLDRLVEFHGEGAKCIVWEHNTHIGDARATDMSRAGMFNIGQLAREEHGEKDVVLVGFGSYEGTVIAGSAWGARMRVMEVPQARADSWEAVMHAAREGNKLLILDRFREDPAWTLKRGHRAIGVVYDPEAENYGNFVPTILPKRYDAFIYLDETKALHPMKMTPGELSEPPETYPFGV